MTIIPLKSTIQSSSQTRIRNDDILTRLPQELLQKIWSYLSASDLQTVSCLNKRMQSSVVIAVNTIEPKMIKNFIEGLIKHFDLDLPLLEDPDLDLFLQVRTELHSIADSICISDTQSFANLLVMKKYILNIQNRLIQSIKKLPGIELPPNSFTFDKCINLKTYLHSHGLHIPYLMEHFGPVMRIQPKIDVWTDSYLRGLSCDGYKNLRIFCKEICEKGFFDQAISLVDYVLAHAVPQDGESFLISWIIKDIIKVYLNNGCFSKAIDIAEFIPNNRLRINTFEHTIYPALVDAGYEEKAKEVILKYALDKT